LARAMSKAAAKVTAVGRREPRGSEHQHGRCCAALSRARPTRWCCCLGAPVVCMP
jgi:hypothetical protein